MRHEKWRKWRERIPGETLTSTSFRCSVTLSLSLFLFSKRSARDSATNGLITLPFANNTFSRGESNDWNSDAYPRSKREFDDL